MDELLQTFAFSTACLAVFWAVWHPAGRPLTIGLGLILIAWILIQKIRLQSLGTTLRIGMIALVVLIARRVVSGIWF